MPPSQLTRRFCGALIAFGGFVLGASLAGAEVTLRLTSDEAISVPADPRDLMGIEFKELHPESAPVSASTGPVQPQVYRVGPGLRFQKPSQIARRVKDGAIVEIMPGTYVNDTVVWRQNDLILRGVSRRPHIKPDGSGRIANRKAIWVITGDRVHVENLEFSGAKVPDRNGAGIRVEGDDLVIRDCYSHQNAFAILTGRLAAGLTVENSEFAFQRRNSGFAHGLYVGDAERFVFRGDYVHHNDAGHQVRSRARAS